MKLWLWRASPLIWAIFEVEKRLRAAHGGQEEAKAKQEQSTQANKQTKDSRVMVSSSLFLLFSCVCAGERGADGEYSVVSARPSKPHPPPIPAVVLLFPFLSRLLASIIETRPPPCSTLLSNVRSYPWSAADPCSLSLLLYYSNRNPNKRPESRKGQRSICPLTPQPGPAPRRPQTEPALTLPSPRHAHTQQNHRRTRHPPESEESEGGKWL